MKKYLLVILACIFICCNSNSKKNNSEFKNSIDGIGISFSHTHDSYVVINRIIKNSSADKAKSDKTLKEGDFVTAVKKNNDLFVSTKVKSLDEIKKIFKGEIGDIIHLQLIRKANNKITKEWSISLPVTKIIFTGYELREAQYYYMIENDKSEFSEEKEKEDGEKFFSIYLKERPSGIATDAVIKAFLSWSNTDSYEKVRDALPLIINDDDVWYRMGFFILNPFYRTRDKKIISEGVELLKDLSKKTTSIKAKTVLLFEIGEYYYYVNDKQTASLYFNKVIKINDDKGYTNSSKEYLYDIKTLNVGQASPKFCVKDINDNEICLDKLKGKYVILHFWQPNHLFVKEEYVYLKEIYNKFSKYDNFSIIGVPIDPNEDLVLREINDESLVWPQVLQNYELKNDLLKKYNIHSVPDMFLIDKDGKIIYRDSKGDDLIIKFDNLNKKLDALILKK